MAGAARDYVELTRHRILACQKTSQRQKPNSRMISLREPTLETIARFLAGQSEQELTYAAVGATAAAPPPGFAVDHNRVLLGQGEPAFAAARRALERWDHFRLGWVEARPADAPIACGSVVAIKAHVVGLWWLNACRIVYVVDEDGPTVRFGFAYGTLPGHAESGEERFLVEWNRADDRVWYDIVAFSRPNHFLARLGYPLAPQLQKRFARDSKAAMVGAASARLRPRELLEACGD